MKYKGKDIKFKHTVGAISELTKLAPNGDVNRLGEIFSEKDLSLTFDSAAQFLATLNKWYEKSLVFEIEGYTPDPVPLEWFMSLDTDEFSELMEDALHQFGVDDQTTVEATEPKGKKND